MERTAMVSALKGHFLTPKTQSRPRGSQRNTGHHRVRCVCFWVTPCFGAVV
uniref:Uncharacterized protein n=1 Tax=Anguilla anguilla TaxID=7936 RepID=A0A0E9VSJ4_ANGAN